jgi:hypothetical protein
MPYDPKKTILFTLKFLNKHMITKAFCPLSRRALIELIIMEKKRFLAIAVAFLVVLHIPFTTSAQ